MVINGATSDAAWPRERPSRSQSPGLDRSGRIPLGLREGAMNMHPFPIVVAILLALAACRPGPAEFSESEAPNRLRLDDASVRVDLRFAAGSARLLSGDAEKLRVMAARGVIAPSDCVQVAMGGGPASLRPGSTRLPPSCCLTASSSLHCRSPARRPTWRSSRSAATW